MNYELAYRVGFHPWEDAEDQSTFTRRIAELFDREESGREPPYGRALDLGTGSGIWGTELARRGWQVTGIEIVEKALGRARHRAQRAGVDMRLVHGDVTALREADIGSGFQLVLDTGTFHGLDRCRAA
jgi:methylase of polypeptide subunit release factors